MIKEVEKIKRRCQEIALEIQKGAFFSNSAELKELSSEKERLEEMLKKYEHLERVEKELKEAQSLLGESDEKLVKFASWEIQRLEGEKRNLKEEIAFLSLKSDPYDEKNALLEIRAGAGGEEAALFASDLFRMYSRYGERKNYKIGILASRRTHLSGIKEIIFKVEGKGAYSQFKYEAGVHRVQRIPKTEAGGRLHTSACSVAVFPELEETDFEIKPQELKIEVFRSSGPGGQHAQKTSSAVRITHLGTGLTAVCQDERSQLKNREHALKILLARLFEKKEEEERKKRGERRRIQIGSGDRSEKIRTYNFPQNRVTDHRINFTSHQLEEILKGELSLLISKLTEEDRKRKLALK